jgi:MFS family permease
MAGRQFAGRFIIGLAGGAFCVSSPQYSAEIAEKEVRGALGSFFQLFFIAGILFAYVVGAFMELFWTNVICALLPLLFGLAFYFMPESPVYLILIKQDDQAKNSLKWLRGKLYDPQEEIDELKMELFDVKKISLKEEFMKRSSIYGIIIAAAMMWFQQVSVIDIVLFYVTIIFNVSLSTKFRL